MKDLRPYEEKLPPKRDYFSQGFRIGLTFGVLAALIILGRERSS